MDFFNVLLELRFTARKARIVSAPAALLCPESTRGKNPCFFPLVAPLFPSANRRSSLPPLVGPAAVRRTKARPKRLNGLFLFARDYFGLLDGPDSAHGRTKSTTKTTNLFNTVVLLIVVPSPMHRI